MEEIFKPIRRLEGFYEISNLGFVRSVDRVGSNGNRYKSRKMTIRLNQSGYPCVGFRRDGKPILRTVHRMLAECFIPNPDGLPDVGHRDLNSTNNSLENLFWTNHSETAEKCHKLGKYDDRDVCQGADHHKARLVADDVAEILRSKKPPQALANEFDVSKSTIKHILKRRTWKSVAV